MSETIVTKRCSKCKEIKSISEFYKNRTKKDGFGSYCKVCRKTAAKEYEQSEKGKATRNRYWHTGKYKELKRRYDQSEKGKKAKRHYRQSEKGKDAKKRFVLQRPELRKARYAVGEAIKKGELPKVDSLQCACGKPAKHYHHHLGYTPEHWLDVIAVCFDCHNNLPIKPLRNL